LRREEIEALIGGAEACIRELEGLKASGRGGR